MKRNTKFITAIAFTIVLLLSGQAVRASTNVTYLTIGSGGGFAGSVQHRVGTTVGQTIIGRAASGYNVYAGIWGMFRSNTSSAISEDTFDFRNKLFLNAPNPFNPDTMIRFSVAKEIITRIAIYDVQGRHVTTLLDETVAAGEHTLNFRPERLPNGVYLLSMNAGSFSASRRIVLQR